MYAFIVNALAIGIGAAVGLLFKKIIKEDICKSLLKAIGVVVIIFGIAGVLKYMFEIKFEDNSYSVSTTNDLLLLVVLTIGTFIGELLKIDQNIKRFGDYIEKKINKSSFSEGFVSSTLIFCVGAMAIIGSVNDAIGDPTIIYLKSAIDAVTAIVLASTLGFGVIFSGVAVLLYQGLITLLAYFLGDFMSASFIASFSMVGYVMVFCIGINFLLKEKIRVANMLPSLILVILYFLIFK